MAERAALIIARLKERGLTPQLRPRIEGLLDGREDRNRLQCCHGGCYVCVFELKAVVEEVEAALRGDGPAT